MRDPEGEELRDLEGEELRERESKVTAAKETIVYTSNATFTQKKTLEDLEDYISKLRTVWKNENLII